MKIPKYIDSREPEEILRLSIQRVVDKYADETGYSPKQIILKGYAVQKIERGEKLKIMNPKHHLRCVSQEGTVFK